MLQNRRVMVVDDEPDILSLLERHLRRSDFEPEGFTDPVKALDSFAADPARFAAVLTDVRMPQMSGIEFARRVHQIKPDAKLVLMTAFEITNEMVSGVPVIRHSEILRKPFKLIDVCESIRRKLQMAG